PIFSPVTPGRVVDHPRRGGSLMSAELFRKCPLALLSAMVAVVLFFQSGCNRSDERVASGRNVAGGPVAAAATTPQVALRREAAPSAPVSSEVEQSRPRMAEAARSDMSPMQMGSVAAPNSGRAGMMGGRGFGNSATRRLERFKKLDEAERAAPEASTNTETY